MRLSRAIALACAAGFLAATGSLAAQRLQLHVGGGHFFADNEYFGHRIEGYTLPGFVLRPALEWRADSNVSLQAGFHWLHYWGAQAYPTGTAYGILPTHTDSASAPLHLLPWMQARVRLGRHVALVAGSLDPDGRRRLPLPLYNPERLYASDPEAGIQLLAHWRRLEAEAWVDWREFIWNLSPRQERFVAGLSASALLADGNGWRLRLPLHLIGQHRGGQVTAAWQPVQNTFNGATGPVLSHHKGNWHLRASCLGMAFAQSGQVDAFGSGWGLYPSAAASRQAGRLRWTADLGYWHGHRFLPLLGSPLFSCLTARDDEPQTAYNDVRLATLGLSCRWAFGEADVQAEARSYLNLTPADDPVQFSLGVHVWFHPVFTLMQ